MAVNVDGVYLCSRAVIPVMIAQKYGRIVNCIAPTAVGTDMVKAFPQQLIDSMIEQTPMGRMASADELSAMVAWMCSEECSFTTGGVFDISGGRATY